MTIGHISYSVRDNCYNLMDSYGEICVWCNACGRIDPKTKWESRLALNERWLEENAKFDNWYDDPDIRKLQETNIAKNAISFQKEIERCKSVIEKARRSHET